MSELLRFDFNQKYVVIDFESNSLNLLEALPWQASWITCQGKKVLSEHDRFPWWENFQIAPQVAAINHFDRYSYKKKSEPAKDVLKDLWEVVSDPSYIIIGQNILGFDVYILNVLRKLCGEKPDYSYIPRVLDTRAIQIAIKTGNKVLDRRDVLSQYKFINYRDKKIKASQGAMLKEYEIPHDPAKLHDGLVDVKMTFEIFLKQIQHIEI